jgi:hypothetical protein
MRNTLLFAVALCMLVSLAGQPPSFAVSPGKVAVRVPFVGCLSDGQVGPVEAPKGESKAVSVAAGTAQQLAYYQAARGPGVLAPRGWYCFGAYGSSGDILYVSPQPIGRETLFSSKVIRFAGPIIEISHEHGDTSGRFGVARMIARVFPAHRAFLRQVIAEDIDSADLFPTGPYPDDKLTYRNTEIVEYQTPAHAEGLGTSARLDKDASPIRGVAILTGPAPDLVFLATRLPPELNALVPAIIQQVERDAARAHP